MTELQSTVLGTLTQDRSFADWYVADKPVGMPFFDGMPLEVTFMDVVRGEEAAFVAEADAVLTAFLQLTTTDRRAATPRVVANYEQMVDLSDIEPLEVDEANPDSIWRYVHPTEVYISRRPAHEGALDHDLYVQVDCNCDWEQEHGLQLVFRQGRMLTRVSEIDGHLTEADAYAKPDSEDEMLMRFAERFAN